MFFEKSEMKQTVKTNQKRFIAGASCPDCSEIDSLVLYSKDQSIECVSCGFTQTTEQRENSSKNNPAKEKMNLGDIKITRVE